jgi:hypothetical protein
MGPGARSLRGYPPSARVGVEISKSLGQDMGRVLTKWVYNIYMLNFE